jgi:predicted nucleic acid-binding protein
MERALILETTFLMDLEREHTRGTPARAMAFLEAHPDANLYLPFVVPGELAAGLSMARREQWEAFIAPFYLLPHTADVSWEFGRTYRHLLGTGQLIGTNDLWIAATALAYDMPVVTANVEHFRRVPHLEVESY